MKKIHQIYPIGNRDVEFEAEVLDTRRVYGREEVQIAEMKFVKPIWIKKGDETINSSVVC